jgi:hypothetical protein
MLHCRWKKKEGEEEKGKGESEGGREGRKGRRKGRRKREKQLNSIKTKWKLFKSYHSETVTTLPPFSLHIKICSYLKAKKA